MDFQDLTEMQTKVFTLIGYSGDSYEKEELIKDYLTISAGKNSDNQTINRPFLVAALMLSQDLDSQTLSEAKGVKFTGLTRPILSLLQLQKSYDISANLTIPLGFSAQEIIDNVNGKDSEVMSLLSI